MDDSQVVPLRPGQQIVADRQRTHGDFHQVAAITQELRTVYRCSPNWQHLAVREREALDMMAVKQARILCGDAAHPDHWRDIAGFAVLGGNLEE